MTDTHHESDYSRGFRHGHQDGVTPSANEAEADMQPLTGNQRLDDGYADGFYQARQSQQRQAFIDLAASIARVLRLHTLAARLVNRGATPSPTPGGN
jgi:hypothetical protein